MFDVITIGSGTRDVFVRSTALEVHPKDVAANAAQTLEACFPLGAKIEVDDLILETGGGATNAAVTFARLGHSAATVASLGDDAPGSDVISALKAEGIATSLLQTHKGKRTGLSVILLSGSGERTVLVYRGAAEKIDGAAIPWRSMRAKWIYLTSVGGDLRLISAILDHAEQHGIRVAWNPGSKEIRQGLKLLAPLIRKVDVLNLNKEEAAMLSGGAEKSLDDIIDALVALPRRSLVVTDGLAGASATERGHAWHCDVLDVPRINVTGAGDAFGSGLVAGLLKKDDIRYGLAVGTWNATGVVQQMGAKRGIIGEYPTAAAIKRIAIDAWKPGGKK